MLARPLVGAVNVTLTAVKVTAEAEVVATVMAVAVVKVTAEAEVVATAMAVAAMEGTRNNTKLLSGGMC